MRVGRFAMVGVGVGMVGALPGKGVAALEAVLHGRFGGGSGEAVGWLQSPWATSARDVGRTYVAINLQQRLQLLIIMTLANGWVAVRGRGRRRWIGLDGCCWANLTPISGIGITA